MIRRSAPYVLICLLLAGCAGQRAAALQEQQRRIVDLQERALASAEKGHQRDATALLQEAGRLAAALDDRELRVTTLLLQSRLARHAQNLMLAGQLLDQASLVHPQTAQAADLAQERALQAIAAGSLDKAQTWALQARQTEPGPLLGRRLNLLARIALLQQKTVEAQQLAEQALAACNKPELQAERANALRTLGISLTRQGLTEQAWSCLQEALELDKQEALPEKIAADLEALAAWAESANRQDLQKEYQERAQAVRKAVTR